MNVLYESVLSEILLSNTLYTIVTLGTLQSGYFQDTHWLIRPNQHLLIKSITNHIMYMCPWPAGDILYPQCSPSICVIVRCLSQDWHYYNIQSSTYSTWAMRYSACTSSCQIPYIRSPLCWWWLIYQVQNDANKARTYPWNPRKSAGYSSDSTQQELSNEYQHDRV